MDTFVSYLVKSALVSGILYAYYLIALRNTKFHLYNRHYLLLAIGVSLILPLINFKWYQIKESRNSSLDYILTIINTANTKDQPFHANNGLLLLSISILVSTIFCGILLSRIIWIYKIKTKHNSIKMPGFTFIETDLRQAPFSFLNNLFWKQTIELSSVDGGKILRHELVHIRQGHTYDKLFSQTIVCLFWMNPFYWLIQKELNVIHEFIADAGSIEEGDTESFAKMLLQAHNGGSYLNPSHLFFDSSIKRRLVMISSSKNVRYSYLRRVLVLPVIMTVVMFSSVSVLRAQHDPQLNPNDTVKNKTISLIKRNHSVADIKDNHVVREIGKQIIQDPPLDEIYFVDGMECSRENVKKLDPQKIKTLNHYTKENAIKRYGEKARNGVFVFTTN